MNASKQLRDVTSAFLGGFSPYLHRVVFDFTINAIEFELFDRIDLPASFRVLRFNRLRELRIIPHDPEDNDQNFADSIIGVQRDGDEFHFHTDRFSISFTCGASDTFERSA